MLIKQQPILLQGYHLLNLRLDVVLTNPHWTQEVPMMQDQLRAKLANLYDFVEVNNIKASSHQKHQFDKNAQSQTFIQGDPV